MTRLSPFSSVALASVALLTLVGAEQPAALSMTSPGDWELTGVSGAKGPVRQCVADLMILTQFEHRGRHCPSQVISDHGNSTVVQYNCGAAGFGRTQIDVLTPRSLRISTQGISDNLPFNYVMQARRAGDCVKNASASPH
jgi:hypothetical protein